MLRKADNVAVTRQKTLWAMLTGRAWVNASIGKQVFRLQKMTRVEFEAAELRQQSEVLFLIRVGDRNYWKFQDRFHWDDEDLAADQVQALLTTRQQRRGAQIERAQQIVAMGGDRRPPTQRGSIADDVKQLVWIRDGGQCRSCGSGTELQFDHVIPVSMGGSSSPENLQVLCGPCNRRKGARVTG